MKERCFKTYYISDTNSSFSGGDNTSELYVQRKMGSKSWKQLYNFRSQVTVWLAGITLLLLMAMLTRQFLNKHLNLNKDKYGLSVIKPI